MSEDARSWWQWHDAKGATDDAVFTALNGPEGADYPKAVQILKSSGRPTAVIDLQVGELIISAFNNSKPKLPPQENVSEGIALLEKAALGEGEGAESAPSVLRSIYETGLGTPARKALAPDPSLASCWTKVKDATQDPRVCIALRKQRTNTRGMR